MGYWKSKVLPKIKKVFEKNGAKKAAASEAIKSFDDSKEEINKEFEEKKGELQPKVTEIYEASSTEIKSLVKEPKEAGLKKHSAEVQKFIEELVKIDFPGSKQVSEISSKLGPALIPAPIFFIFEKVSTLTPTPAPEEAKPTEEGTTSEDKKDKEIVIEEEKKEEIVAASPAAVEEKTEPVPAEPTKEDPPKA